MSDTSQPPGTQLGYVVGRLLRSVGDGGDADRAPDALPAQGSITITPKQVIRKVLGPPPVTVIQEKVDLTLDGSGRAVDARGGAGVWLVAGAYEVVYSIKGVAVNPPKHDILVGPEHTEAAPLDLTSALPPGGPVVSASQYAELSARLDALGSGGGGGAPADPRLAALAGYRDLGEVSGAVEAAGRGTVALTLSGPTQVTLTGQDGDSVLIDADLAGHTLTVEGKAVGAVSVWARSRGRWITGQPVAGGGDSGGGDGGGTTTPPTGSTLVGKIAFAGVADGTDPATLTLTPSGATIQKNNANGAIAGGKWSVSSTGAVVGSTLSTAQQLTKMLATATYTMTGTSGNDAASIGIGVHAGMAGTVSLTVRGDGSMLMEGIGIYTWTMPDLSTRVAPKTGTIAISFDATTGGGSVWLNGTKIGDYTSDWASKNPAGKAQGVAISAKAFNGGKTSFDGYEMAVPA